MDLIHHIQSSATPWAALSLLLLGRNPHLSRKRIAGSLLLAFFLLCVPVAGWSFLDWIRMLEPNPSITLTALLGIALWERTRAEKIFTQSDWSAAWGFGALAALALYPMGLGLTGIDPYVWGWGPMVPLATAALATVLLMRGNRFGIVLILPMAGTLLHLQESRNTWDALIDPFYAICSLAVVALTFKKKFIPASGD